MSMCPATSDRGLDGAAPLIGLPACSAGCWLGTSLKTWQTKNAAMGSLAQVLDSCPASALPVGEETLDRELEARASGPQLETFNLDGEPSKAFPNCSLGMGSPSTLRVSA